MSLVDTHTHLYLDQFQPDFDNVIQRAIDCGITKMILPNIDSDSLIPLIDLCEKYPKNCFPALGLHPTSVKDNYKSEWNLILKKIETTPNIIAIGEIGIDLYWDKTHLKEQKIIFKEQIDLAKSLNLPIIIHARDSFDEIFEIVDRCVDGNLHGVFHSFTGNIEDARRIIDYKTFFLGVGGIVTFKNSGLDAVLAQLSLENIVLETDSPFLAPVPFRGQRNETSYMIKVVERLSEIWSVSRTMIENTTTENAYKLFGFE